MIKIQRNKKPRFFDSLDYFRLVEELFDLKKEETELKKLSKYRNSILTSKIFSEYEYYFTKKIKRDLSINFNSKCAYCETSTSGNIDRFRPPFGSRGLKGNSSSEHYWWLMFEWNNLYNACATCIRNKASWFPVKEKRIKVLATYPEISNETNLIIDPCLENPEDHLKFVKSGKVFPLTEKGKVTIDILKLNRTSLVVSRKKAIDNEIERILKSNNLENISKELYSAKNKIEYLQARRAVVNSYIHSDISKVEEDYKPYNASNVLNSYITSLELKNFKRIKNLKLNVADTASEKYMAPWTVFLGENGVGKSTVLQAVALCMTDKKHITLLTNTKQLINNKSNYASIKLETDDETDPILIEFTNSGKTINSNFKVNPNFVIGFGSSRLISKKKDIQIKLESM